MWSVKLIVGTRSQKSSEMYHFYKALKYFPHLVVGEV